MYVPVLDARGVVTEPQGAPVEVPSRPPPLPNGLRLEERFFNAAAVMLYGL